MALPKIAHCARTHMQKLILKLPKFLLGQPIDVCSFGRTYLAIRKTKVYQVGPTAEQSNSSKLLQ